MSQLIDYIRGKVKKGENVFFFSLIYDIVMQIFIYIQFTHESEV